MKKILFIGFIILSTLSCKAQIIPIEEHKNYLNNEIEIPDGAYIKDVNHLLDKFVGVWKGTYNNKNYEFRITQFTDSFLGISVDELLMRYKITSLNGTIIEDTTTLPNDAVHVIEGDYLDKSKFTYVLNYIGKNSKCGQHGDVFISVYGVNNTKMQLFLHVYGETVDCITGDTEQILPLDQMDLVKQ